MSDQDQFEDVVGYGDGAAPSSRRRLRRRTGIGLLVAGGIAIAVTGVATAQNPSPSGSPTPTATSSAAPDRGQAPDSTRPRPFDRRGPRFHGHGLGGLRFGRGGGVVHGEFVVPKAGGGYQTIATQRGTVTAVNARSISVRSSDGYTATYVVSADTLVNAARDGIGSIKVDTTVHVMATRSGSTRTAVGIVDVSTLRATHERLWPKPARPATPPSPAPSGSNQSSSGSA
jgi:hypothetical protein